MASYEVEHDLPTTPAPEPRPNRPDLSAFFSALMAASFSPSEHTNPHALPTPPDVSAVYTALAMSFERLLRARTGEGRSAIEELVRELLADADMPPPEVKGVPDAFFDQLERLDKNTLSKDDVCGICQSAFLDDPYPLVVRLPCHPKHIFDLECVQPWLKLHTTCPSCRKDLVKKDVTVRPKETDNEETGASREVEEEEEEWDGMFG